MVEASTVEADRAGSGQAPQPADPRPATALGRRRPRLHHVDAMRPVKQAGVVTTHSLLFFAPATTVAVGAGLLVTHVTRFAFMFISAAMLVYAYPELRRAALPTFWRRRLLAVALPYVTWTLVYFVMESLPISGIPAAFRPSGGITGSVPVSLAHLGQLLVRGYYQLYYLVLLLELYLAYPAFLWLLRATRRHHGLLVGASVALQLVLVGLVHWGLVPGWLQGYWATRELWNYQLYLVGGGVMAWHYEAVHAWLVRRWRLVLGATAVTLALAEGWYAAASTPSFAWLAGDGAADPFQPVLIPLFMAVIAALYLLGVAMARPGLSARMRGWVSSGADNSYGVYLSQVLFITALAALGWGRLDTSVPWPVVAGGAVVIVYGAAVALTALLARLPGARATAGRARLPRRSRLATPAGSDVAWTPTPASPSISGDTLAALCADLDPGIGGGTDPRRAVDGNRA